jgi:hypothetical protein
MKLRLFALYFIVHGSFVIIGLPMLLCCIRQDIPILILKKFLDFIVGVTGVCVSMHDTCV